MVHILWFMMKTWVILSWPSKETAEALSIYFGNSTPRSLYRLEWAMWVQTLFVSVIGIAGSIILTRRINMLVSRSDYNSTP